MKISTLFLSFRQDTVSVTVFPMEGSVTVVEEKWLYDKDDFIADVGGYLGLLLGASVISIAQAVVEFVRAKGWTCSGCRKKGKEQENRKEAF